MSGHTAPAPEQTLPGRIPGQGSAQPATPVTPVAPAPAAPAGTGKVQDVPK